MRVLVGTSGYNYPEWRGTFYPDGMPATEMFALLRRAVPHGRDQLHVLPDAHGEDVDGWHDAGAGGSPTR